MDIIPKRTSLVAQTVQVLRDMIQSGEWTTHLPTEGQLKDRMQVGRNTVRSALEVLTKEGWISEGRPGLRREIIKRGQKPTRGQTKVVIFLAPNSLEHSHSQVIFIVDGLRDHLAEMGYRMEVHTSKAYRLESPDQTLEALVKKNPADLWILLQSTRAMQEWFSQQAIPCMVNGSTYEGIQLPCVDLDYAATTRHAVGQLVSKGHTHLAFMLPGQQLYGDKQAELAFWEALALEKNPNRKGTVIRVPSNDLESVCRELKRTMLQSDAPTGLILWRALYSHAVFSYAPELGLRIPKDLSVICMNDSPSAEWVWPSLARYTLRPDKLISKLFRLGYQLLTVGPGSRSRISIQSSWQAGGSLARAPSSDR